MATLTVIQPVHVLKSDNSSPRFAGGPEYPHFKETAGQSYGIGDFLYIDSSGTIAICTVDGSSILSSRLAGQATAKATGVTGTGVHFRIITEQDLFIFNVYHGTAASAITAQTQLGTRRQLKKINSVWRVDIENSIEGATDSAGQVTIVNFPLRHPDGTKVAIGDVNGLVLCHFNNVSIASDGNPNTPGLLQLA